MTQDLRAGHLRGGLPFGQRLGGLLQVDTIELDPLAAGVHQRPSLLRQPCHLTGGQLDIVEQHRPRHVGELVSAHDRTGRLFGEQAQRWRCLAPRDLRRAHVEAGGHESGPDHREEVPRFVLAEGQLPTGSDTCSSECREDATQPSPLRQRGSAAFLCAQRLVDRYQLALDRSAIALLAVALLAVAHSEVHRHQPHAAGTGCLELHDQPRVCGVGDRPGPLVEAP